MEPVQPSPPATPTSSLGLFGTKIPASAAFLVALLLFLLPFVEIKCNMSVLANNTGVGIAMGKNWNTLQTDNSSLFGKNSFGRSDVDGDANGNKDFNKQEPNKFAIAALGLGIIGLLIAFLGPASAGKINLFIGLLAAVSLIAMLIDLKSKAKSENSVKSTDMNLDAGVSISVDGTAAFYITIILFALAAFFSWQRSKMKN